MKPPVHKVSYRIPSWMGAGLTVMRCGIDASSGWDLESTDRWDHTTCKNCLRCKPKPRPKRKARPQ